MTKRVRIFLSYSATDRRFAQNLKRQLERRGVQVTPDAYNWDGQDWAKTIRSALSRADAVVTIVSNAAGVLAELGAARSLGKAVVAILPERTRLSDSEPFRAFSPLPLIDAAALRPTQLLDRVLDAVESVTLNVA